MDVGVGGELSVWGDNVRRDLDRCQNCMKGGLVVFSRQVALGGCGKPQDDLDHRVVKSKIHTVAGKEVQLVALNAIVGKEFSWGVSTKSDLLVGDNGSAKVALLCKLAIAVLLSDILHMGELKCPPPTRAMLNNLSRACRRSPWLI